MGEKPFSTFDKQIEILKSRGLLFNDESYAKDKLSFYGYYEIINGYKDFLLDKNSTDDRYLTGATFEHIFSLYQMDKQIASGVMESMKEVELTLRTAVAHTIAEQFGEKTQDYLKRQNYKTGPKNMNGPGYKIDQILNKLSYIVNDDIQPMKHYRECHGNVPPWILLKGSTFGNLVNFIKLQKPKQKERIISLAFGIPEEVITEQIKDMFADIIFLCHAFRNRAAHGGRMYNYKPAKAKIRYNKPFHDRMNISEADYRVGKGKNSLYTLLKALSWFKNDSSKIILEVSIELYISRHCKLYPDESMILEQIEFPPDYSYKFEDLINK